MMLTFEEFTEKVKADILNYLPDQYSGAQVAVNEVVKTNDQKFMGLSIRQKSESVAPNIYLEDFYENFRKTGDMDGEVKKIAEMHMQYQNNHILDFDVTDYEQIKDRLFIVVLNKENSRDYISNGISQDVEGTDMTTLVKVNCTIDGQGTGSFKVNSQQLQIWNISKEALYEQAKNNTPVLFPMELKNMIEVLCQMLSSENLSEEERLIFEDLESGNAENATGNRIQIEEILPYEQYMLSNESHLNGATVMLYPDVLKQIAEKSQGNIFIIPSSIHEVILMKDNGELSAEELQHMVIEVNRTQVAPEEILSDEVYCYDYKEHALTQATDKNQTKELIARLKGEFGYENGMMPEEENSQMNGEDYGEEQ